MTDEEKSKVVSDFCDSFFDPNEKGCFGCPLAKDVYECTDRNDVENYDILVKAGLIPPDDEVKTADDKVDEAHERFMNIVDAIPAEKIQRKREWLLEMCDKTQNSDEGCHSCPYRDNRCKDFVIYSMSANNVIDWFNDWNRKLFHNESDAVHSPSHYTKGGIECINAIKASMTSDGFCDYCKGNVLKYIWRWRDKGGVQDLEKAKVYLNWLIEEAEK